MKGWSAHHPIRPCLEGAGWGLQFQDLGLPVSYCWGPDLQLHEQDHHSGSSELAAVETETTQHDAGT